jgi:SAM-dependent methyltransferase
MNQVVEEFRKKINRQRTSPSIFDYSYQTLRNNVKTFEEFAPMVPEGALVLDAGCGFKPWERFFSAGTQYVGVDYSVEWSTPDGLASVDFLPFKDNTFDAIICSEVLEHTRYPENCINELKRVCKPGGLMYISTPFCFPEHGVPYDFQRLTQYFYKDVFKADEIVRQREGSSTLGSAFTCFNFFVECTPLRMIWGFRQLFYLTMNLATVVSDAVIDFAAPKLMRSLRLYTHMLPLGYSLIVRVKKG